MNRHHRLTAPAATVIATAITCLMLALAASAGATTDIPGSPEARIHAADRISHAAAAQPTIVHETITAHSSDSTLPIALAASALLISLASTGYTIILATKTSRRAARHSA